jgi:Tol biopolymer transport system component
MEGKKGTKRSKLPMGVVIGFSAVLSFAAPVAGVEHAPESPELLGALKVYPCKVVYESYRDGNWDLWLMNADGSDPVNLTKTPNVDEMYPKASPDGTKICFVVDEGRNPDRCRNVYVMNIDGTGRRKIVHKGRWPCWGSDGKTIAYLKGPKRYSMSHNATGRLYYYDLATGKSTPHVNKDIAKLLCISWSPDRKWFVSTAAGGMGHGFSIIAFEADGPGNYDLLGSKKGAWQCRPDFAPDGKQIAFASAAGEGPPEKIFMIEKADLDLTAEKPTLSNRRRLLTAAWPTELYHADWSPDGKFMLLARGPREMSRMKPQRAIIGVEAPGWDVCVVEVGGRNRWVRLTKDGRSNKEPDWVPAKQ